MGFFEDIGFYGELVWWAILIYMAYWLYNWTREKLGFSPLLVFVVAVILIYYLVIEHPFIGALGIFGWIFLTAGLVYVLGMLPQAFFFLKYRR